MKKLLILVLTLACLVSLVACDNGGNNDKCDHVDANGDGICDTCNEKIGDPASAAVKVKAFADAVQASKPAVKAIVVTWGEYRGEATVTCNADGSKAIAYSYTQKNTIPATEETKTVTGTTTRAADGTFAADAPEWLKGAEGIAIDVAQNAEKCTVNGNTLVGNVAQADTTKVLGTELAADAVVTVILSGDRVAKTVVNFENDGAWEISTTYSYAD